MKDNKDSHYRPEGLTISQSVAILIDGNNIERSIHSEAEDTNTMLNFDELVPKLLDNRGLSRLVYFREGKSISAKLQERLYNYFHGSVRACHKSADIPLSIYAIQVANKVDTIIIMSGDSDYVELVNHLKSEGVRVEIAAVPSTTSQVLRDEADHYHEITREDWFTLPQKSKKKKHRSK
ncbi:MAG TPA: NYN domain-containing protein [Gammaproteobacteria bacterium]|nr:NYN domain-containing protein [Gammaproteobacteria bacterium]